MVGYNITKAAVLSLSWPRNPFRLIAGTGDGQLIMIAVNKVHYMTSYMNHSTDLLFDSLLADVCTGGPATNNPSIVLPNRDH